MRFEACEPRIVFDQALGTAVEFVIAPPAPATASEPIPEDIQLRSSEEDFLYSSETVDANVLDAFIAATDAWAEDPAPIHTFSLSDDEAWHKIIFHNPISVHPDGYIVAERVQAQPDTHTLVVARRPGNECHLHNGLYLRPDHHYRYSFDIRHPETEASWLTTIERHWSVVTQLWGPASAGVGLNPPFSIHTSVQNGQPYWAISNRGDANLVTERPYDEERFQYVPIENLGEWHHWDIEYVPNHEGQGLVRVWLNGDLVADWVDVKSSYLGHVDGEVAGPLNPGLGLYSYDAADGQEAHFDNVSVQCSGVYETSISGRVTGGGELAGNLVYATNVDTGERFGVETGKSGVYAMELPSGTYTVSAVNQETGFQTHIDNVSTLEVRSQVIDLDVTTVVPQAPVLIQTLTGDVTGDGNADAVQFFDDGSWYVSSLGTDGQVTTERWTTWSTNTGWQDVMMGDFNGDNLQDVIGRADDGSWWTAQSNGQGFQNIRLGKWTPTVNWLHVNVGDFNGDGLSDIVGRADSNGSWWVAQSTGTQFNNTSWGRWTTLVDWEVVHGDFNGDGLSDIAGRASTDGTWWIGASNGERFLNSYWGRFSQNVPWSEFMAGDFNGDGRTDLIARAGTDGTWWVAESQGDRFLNRYFGRWMATIEWRDVQVADVNGDAVSDIVGRAASDNSWWAGQSNGERFQNQYWGTTWSNSVDWLAAFADDFDGDNTADLLGINTEALLLMR